MHVEKNTKKKRKLFTNLREKGFKQERATKTNFDTGKAVRRERSPNLWLSIKAHHRGLGLQVDRQDMSG